MLAHSIHISRSGFFQRLQRRINHVVDLGTQHAAYGFKQQPPTGQTWMLTSGFLAVLAEQGHIFQLLHAEQAGANAIINVVGVVGNLIGKIGQLRLQARLPVPWCQKPVGHAARFTGVYMSGVAPGTVLQNPLAGFKGEVQAVVGRVALFQRIHHPQALQIVLKTGTFGTVGFQAVVQGVLARVAKRGMTQVVRQGNRFHQVLVELQRAGNRATELRHLQRMRQAGAKQITLVV